MKSRIINLQKTRTYSLAEPKPNGVDILEELLAEEGMFLTQAKDVPLYERVFTPKLVLGTECNSDDWREITAEEMRVLKAQKQKDAEERRKAKLEKYKSLRNENTEL